MSRDEELLAAYLDGVAELTPEERRRVEAQLSGLDVDGTKTMLEQLRALPPEGDEPDWRALERRIAGAVDDVRTPWWRRRLVPASVLAVAATVLAVYLHHAPAKPAPPPIAAAIPDAAAAVAPVEPTEIWIAGQLLDIRDADPDALDELDDAPIADDDLLPPSDLRWVDQLDDGAIDRAEHWLERKKS